MNPHKRYTYNPYRIIAYTTSLILLVALIPLIAHKKSGWSAQDFRTQKLKWEECYDTFQCTSFKVPVDYQSLDQNLYTNQFFTLQVLRQRASDLPHRIGSLIVNPGGPGGSGTNYAYNADSIVSPAISKRYDIVGFDPRGVSASEPIRCLSDKEEDQYLSASGEIGTSAQFKELLKSVQSFAEKCATAAGKKLGHYSTLEAAKDMEILRILLGDAKLNYLGKSYGTYLGTIYADLYPSHIGHMVLDGAVDPTIPINKQALTQAISFDQALNDFLKRYPTITLQEITGLIKESQTQTLRSKNRLLTDSLLTTAMADALYDNESGWPLLYEALTSALKKRDASKLLVLADDYNQRDIDGHYLDNQSDISTVINCLDWSDNRSLTQIRNEAKSFAAAAPIFGPFIAYTGIACHFWKASPLIAELPKQIHTSVPIMIVGVTRDPATPYIWAVGLHQLLTNSTLLTFHGEGHTGIGRGDSTLDQQVDQYFLVKSTP